MHILDLVEDDTSWLVNSPESGDSSQKGGDEHDVVVTGWQPEDVIVFDSIGCVWDVVLWLGVRVGDQALCFLSGLDERNFLGDRNWSSALLYYARLTRRRRRARSVSSLRHGVW